MNEGFDPFDKATLANPYPRYAWLRDEAPCHYVPQYDCWVVSRYDDVVATLRDHATFSSTGGVGLDWKQHPMMPMYDPPQHSRLRRLVAPHFTPRAISALAPRFEQAFDALLAPMLEKGGGDLVQELALPFVLGVIADLIGIPEERRRDFRRWSEGVVEGLVGGLDEKAAAAVASRQREFVAFLKEHVAERRARDTQANDMISLLVHANDDERLTNSETVAFCVLLLVAGFETTVNGIANGALALLENRDQLRIVAKDPSKIPAAIEEVIRYDCPVQSFFRNTLKETTIAGTAVPQGVKVMVLFGSANRDPRHFADADSFRVERNPSDHVGFGVGIHYCLGAPLARVQMALAARAILGRVSKVRSMDLDGPIEHFANPLFRGLRRLPIALKPR